MPYKAIVIGSSAGGLQAAKTLLKGLKSTFRLPIIIAQHISPHSNNYMAQYLDSISAMHVKEADEKECIEKGHVYIAPPNFHLLIEENQTFSLTVDDKVNYARPSIDVLFETAAFAYKKSLIGIILTGANNDGAQGIRMIKAKGGYTIAQNPETAEVNVMPQSAIDTGCIDQILDLDEIIQWLNQFN